MKVTASPKNVGEVAVDVTITATVAEWREFQKGCLSEPKYSPIKRELGQAIDVVVRNLQTKMTEEVTEGYGS